MKNKQFAIFSLSVLILLTLVSFASATSSVTATVSGTATTFSIPSTVQVLDNKGNIAEITLSPTLGTIPSSITVESTDIASAFGLGTFTKTLTHEDLSLIPENVSLAVKVKNDACKYADNGNLGVDITNIKVVNGYGDDTEWYPLDEVEVRINVENQGNDDIRKIIVEWALYDQTTQTKIISGEEDDFTLNDGDEKELTVNFKLDKISKLKSGDKYVFYAWATGRDTSYDHDKYICSSTTNEESGEDNIILNLDSNFVIVDEVSIADSVSCGNQIEVTGKVWNIGEDDEDDVYFRVYNAELGGVLQKVELGDIDSLDSQDFSFTLNVPADAEEKDYELEFYVYDDNDDVFENDNGDQAKTKTLLSITSGCSTEAPALVNAKLDSEAVAGKELIIKTTITNADSKTNTFTIGVDEYSQWATLGNIDQTSITLNAGESKDVVIKLNVNNDASGDKNLNIVVKKDDKVLSQPVSVAITRPSFLNLTGIFSGFKESNSYLYGIVALNVLLVLIIIVVATRMAKKKKE